MNDEMSTRCAQRMFENDEATRSFGIRITENGPGTATATMTVAASMLNGFGVCHGGYLFALADTAFAYACNSYNRLTLAAGGSIDFLRPAEGGDVLTAVAEERSRGGRSGTYDVCIRNQHGDMIALFRGRSHATNRPILSDDASN